MSRPLFGMNEVDISNVEDGYTVFQKKQLDREEFYCLDKTESTRFLKFKSLHMTKLVYDKYVQDPSYDASINDIHNTVHISVPENKELMCLPSGVYNFCVKQIGYSTVLGFAKTELRSDNLAFVPKVAQDIKDRIFHYLSKKPIYDKHNQPFRTSYLLYGPPGTGKSTLLRSLIAELTDQKDYLVIFTDAPIPRFLVKVLNKDPRTKFIIMEELTAALKEVRPKELLDFLDGENSILNAITIATTNYPENLPGNLAQRKGRFDRFYKIDKMELDENIKFAETILGRQVEDNEVKYFLNINVSEIKDMCYTHLVENVSFEQYKKDLEKHKSNYSKYFEEYKQNSLGLGAGDED